jgi:hypothetical protein
VDAAHPGRRAVLHRRGGDLRAKVDLQALPFIFFALGAAAVFVLWARRRVTAHFQLNKRRLSR